MRREKQTSLCASASAERIASMSGEESMLETNDEVEERDEWIECEGLNLECTHYYLISLRKCQRSPNHYHPAQMPVHLYR